MNNRISGVYHNRAIPQPKSTKPPCKVGDRIRLIQMGDDPDPIPPGTTGTVLSCNKVWHLDGQRQIDVKWDIPRSLKLVWPTDQIEIIK